MTSHAVFMQGANVHVIHFDWAGGGGGGGANVPFDLHTQFSTLIFDDLKHLDYTLKRHKNVP